MQHTSGAWLCVEAALCCANLPGRPSRPSAQALPSLDPPLQLTGLGIGLYWDPSNVAKSFSAGADWAWYSNAYDWKPFLAALLCSTTGTLLWCTGAWALRKFAGVRGVGISDILMKVGRLRGPGHSRGRQRQPAARSCQPLASCI